MPQRNRAFVCVYTHTHRHTGTNTQKDIPAVIFHRTPCFQEQRTQTGDERMRKKKVDSGCENLRKVTGGWAGAEGGEKISENIE